MRESHRCLPGGSVILYGMWFRVAVWWFRLRTAISDLLYLLYTMDLNIDDNVLCEGVMPGTSQSRDSKIILSVLFCSVLQSSSLWELTALWTFCLHVFFVSVALTTFGRFQQVQSVMLSSHDLFCQAYFFPAYQSKYTGLCLHQNNSFSSHVQSNASVSYTHLTLPTNREV